MKSRTLYLVPLAWLVFCYALYGFYVHQRTKSLVAIDENRMASILQVYRNLHQWTTEMGGVLVPQETGIPPSEHLPPSRRTETTSDGRTFVRIDPSCLLRLLDNHMNLPGMKLRLPAARPQRPQSIPDDWEQRGIDGFKNDPEPIYSRDATADTPEERYMTPLFAGKACLTCHKTFQENELLGALSLHVASSTEKALQETRSRAALLFGALGISVGALIFCGLYLNRRTISTLAYKEQRTRIMANLVDAVLFEFNLEKGNAAYSPLWQNVFGCPPPETATTPQEALCSRAVEEDRRKLRDMFAQLQQGSEKAEADVRLRRENAEPLWCRIQACNLRDDKGHPRIVGSITDIDAEKKERLALQHKALYDSLTGILNRSGFQAAVELACGSHCADHGHCPGKTGTPGRPDLCPRTGPVPPCVFGLVDMDHFKEINDTHGHLAGDAILQKLGATLRDSFAQPASVGRLGGDEFAFFLPQYPGMEALERRLTEFQQRLAAVDIVGAPIQCSIGVIVEVQGECRYRYYYELADRALYAAKDKGRNCYVIHNGVAILPSLDAYMGKSR